MRHFVASILLLALAGCSTTSSFLSPLPGKLDSSKPEQPLNASESPTTALHRRRSGCG